MNSRDDLTANPLLFTTPQSWKPLSQQSFEMAARYYGVKNPERMRYNFSEVPF